MVIALPSFIGTFADPDLNSLLPSIVVLFETVLGSKRKSIQKERSFLNAIK